MSSADKTTRTKILNATLTLLEAGRGQGVRMTDVAKAAGISRQAVYLHFESRADLLIETTFYLDRLKNTEQRLAASRSAKTGVERLDAYVAAWADYLPEIYPMARALMSMRDTDAEAAAAWNQRMQDMWEGCEAAIKALARDGTLSTGLTVRQASDLLWTLLSVRNYEHLTVDRGWSQAQFRKTLRKTAHDLFVAT